MPNKSDLLEWHSQKWIGPEVDGLEDSTTLGRALAPRFVRRKQLT
jgi:hypothetical protein